jgi:hypothetical protein
LPATLLPTLLKLLGASSVEELMAVVGRAARHGIPPSMQRRLLRVFQVGLYGQDSESVEFAFRPIELEFGGETYECLFPCKKAARPVVEASVDAFALRVKGRGKKLQVSARVGVSTNNFLVPRTPADAAFCESFVVGSGGTQAAVSPSQKLIPADWLGRAGLSKSLAQRAAEDEDLRSQLHLGIRDRIEELVYVSGAHLLLDEDEQQLPLDGDEERGYSR